MAYLNELKERIKLSNPIEEVIRESVPLGSHNKALCPFHKEDTPSFFVNVKEQYFHCFGCGAGGDVFNFVMRQKGMSFSEALKYLAERKGIQVSFDNVDLQEEQKRRDIYSALSEAAKIYHESLPAEVIDYLKGRGLTEETIKAYRIGFCNGQSKYRLPHEVLLNAGLIYENGRNYFEGFITFPHILYGRVVYISGRGYPEKKHKKLETDKVQLAHLYNEQVLSQKEVILAEGEIDTLTLLQHGFNACGVLGAGSFKDEWVNKFKNCETVYLSLDGDEAGIKGSLRIGNQISEKARIVCLPAGMDINDYFNSYTKDDFDKLIASSKDIIKYELGFIPPDTDKTELPQKLEAILRKLSGMEKAKMEAYLNYEIKPRFKLKKEDVDGYRDAIMKYRRADIQLNRNQAENEEVKPVYTAIFEGLIDIVEKDGEPAFLIKEGDNLSIESSIKKDSLLYLPPPKEQIPWLMPQAEQILRLHETQSKKSPEESDKELYDELLAYHKSVSELPEDGYYDLIAAWDLHTYLLESTEYSPIICLFAVPERGKSRTGKGMIHVAFRGIHVESLRDAYLVRVANDLGASLFFDVKDIWKKAENNGSEDILLHRFEKGAKVPRVLFPDKGAHRDIVYYSIFGPTIISTNEGIHRILETRAIPINMPETTKRFEEDVTPLRALPLKEKLVAFRARHYSKGLPNIPKPASGRLGDILKPIQQIMRLVRPEREAYFLKLVKRLESEKLIEKADTIEAQILAVLSNLRNSVDKGMLSVKEITDSFNEDRSDKYKVTYQRIGRRLSAMGFGKVRTSNGASAIVWDEEKLVRIKESYGLSETSETPDTSDTPDGEPYVTDVSCDTDDSRRPF